MIKVTSACKHDHFMINLKNVYHNNNLHTKNEYNSVKLMINMCL